MLDDAKTLFNNEIVIKAAYKAAKKCIIEAVCDFDIIEVALTDLALFEKNVKGEFDKNFFNELKKRQGCLDSLYNVPYKNRGTNHWQVSDSVKISILQWKNDNGYNEANYATAKKYPPLRSATLWCVEDIRKTLKTKM